MNDNEKLVLWSILVVLLLIIIGIINPFLLILILSIFIYIQSYILTNIQSECFAINQHIS